MPIRTVIKDVVQRFGFQITRLPPGNRGPLPIDLSAEDGRTVLKVRPYTMTSIDRIAAVIDIDDYGFWAGARKAVDEFFETQPGQDYFHRIDYTGRLITRVGE